MNKKWKKKIAVYIASPVLLSAAAGIVLGVGGKSVWEMALGEFQHAVVSGAPEYEYDTLVKEGEDTPTEGEVSREGVKLPAANTQFGEINCSSAGLQMPLYYGDSDEVLEKGAGLYIGSSIPGENKTMLVGGHDTTFMSPLKNVKVGDCLEVTTTYGTFIYKVKKMQVADIMDTTAYDLSGEGEQLILYTCYPFGEVMKDRSKRYFVYADKESGPAFKEESHEQ